MPPTDVLRTCGTGPAKQNIDPARSLAIWRSKLAWLTLGEQLCLLGVGHLDAPLRLHAGRCDRIGVNPTRSGLVRTNGSLGLWGEHQVLHRRLGAKEDPTGVWRALPERADQHLRGLTHVVKPTAFSSKLGWRRERLGFDLHGLF